MSAIALHDLHDLETVPARRRDHLRVVPAGPVTGGAGRGESAADRDAALTLTRRGRLAITMTVATVVVLAAVAAFGMFPATAVGGQTVTVQPGQTLSEIAVTQLPGVPMDRAIVQIQLANEMSTLHVQAGMELEIPRP